MMDRLSCGPCVWWTFDDLYGTRQAVNRALRRLDEDGLAECVGEVSFDGEGGNCYVWAAAGLPIRRNQLKHDVIANDVRLLLGLEYLFHPDTDAPQKADITVFDALDKAVDVEIDTGSMTIQEVVSTRYPKYRETDRPCVWVSCGLWGMTDEKRLTNLRVRATGAMRQWAWFTTLAAIRAGRLQTELVNYDLERRTFEGLFKAAPDLVPAEPRE